VIDHLASLLLNSCSKKAPTPVEVRIPADHPKVGRLIALFEALSTGARMPSGIIITGGAVSDDATTIFLRAMSQFLAEDGIDFNKLMKPLLAPTAPPVSISSVMASCMGALGQTPSVG